MKIPKKIVLIFFAALVIIIAIIVFVPANNSDNNAANASNTIGETQNVDYENLNDIVFPVKTSLAFKGNLIKYVFANGILKSFNRINVAANISGKVEKINIYNGKSVHKGDTLLTLDNREYLIDLNDAKNKIISAQIDYGFLKKETFGNNPKNISDTAAVDSINNLILLNEKNFKEEKLTESEYLKRKNELELSLIFTGAKRDEVILNKSGLAAALNQLNRAKVNISYSNIIAPFNGVIADFNISPGQKVNANEDLFKLLDNSKFKVDVGVLEDEIVSLKPRSKAIVKVNALPNKIFEGKILYINPLIDPQLKTAQVTVEINNSNNNLKEGMYASVEIQSEIFKDRTLIPKEALLIRDKRSLAFIVENGLAKWHYIDVGESNNKYIEVKNGIEAGDTVIVEGNYNLAHDAKIKIVN